MCADCYQQVRSVKAHLTCAWCGKDFDRALYQHEKALKRGITTAYCSRACSSAHHAVKNAKMCAHCGKPMPGKRNNRYCSPECRTLANPRKVLRDRACEWCEMPFHPVHSKVRFCSRTCASAAHSVRMRGKGNSNYKTGTSYAKWYAEMRPLIFERDMYRCVVCQAEAQMETVTWKGQLIDRTTLVVHHIDDNPANNTPENLITLCKTCHAVHHKSAKTPWPWLDTYAQVKSQSMTSKWKSATTSLQKAYSLTTAP